MLQIGTDHIRKAWEPQNDEHGTYLSMFALKGEIFVYFNILIVLFLSFFVVIISLNKLMKNTITVNVNHKLANLLLQLPLQKLTVAYGFLLQLINK